MDPSSLTRTWHKDVHAAIDRRSRPEFKLLGKTVVILAALRVRVLFEA